MHVAFSTLACPEWSLDRIARTAGALAYDAVELRTFGFGASSIVSDPALTDPRKIRATFAEHGVRPGAIATSLRFDRTIFPPIIGRAITDQEREVRTTKRLIDLASAMECPALRVFAFEMRGRESRAACLRRIAWRLGMATDAARHSGVRIVLENGGSFSTAADLAEILAMIPSPALGACYNVAAARHAGEDPVAGLALIADRTPIVRLKGHRAGAPCLLADGDDPNEQVVRAMVEQRSAATIVYEFDRAWHEPAARDRLPDPHDALRHAIETIYSWMASPAARSGASRATVATVAV